MSDQTPAEMPELNAEMGEGYEKPPVGIHQAICFGVIDLGTQKGEYEGRETESRKVRLGFEFEAENSEGEDTIFTHWKEYTLSFGGNSKLRKHVDAWNGGEAKLTNKEAKTFDVYTLLGKEGAISIVHKKKKNKPTESYADIDSISPRMKKIEMHERKAKNTWLLLHVDHYKEAVFQAQPKFIQERIEKSPEYEAMFTAGIEKEGNVETKDATTEDASEIFDGDKTEEKGDHQKGADEADKSLENNKE